MNAGQGRRSELVLRFLGVALLVGCVGGVSFWLLRDSTELLDRSSQLIAECLERPDATDCPEKLALAKGLADQYLSGGGSEPASARCLQSAALLLDGRTNEAVLLFEQYDPRGASTRTLLALAEALSARGQPGTAQTLIEELLTREDEQPRTLRLAIIVASNMGRDEIAMQLAYRWAALAPDDPEPWRMMAIIHLNRVDSELAVAAFREVDARHGKLAPRDRFEYVQQLVSTGRAKEARQQWERLPEDPSVAKSERLLLESKLLYLETDFNAADERAQQAVREDSKNSAALVQAGRLALMRNRMPEAETRLRRAVELAPRDLDAIYLLSRVELKQGRNEEATKLLARHRHLRDLALEVHRLETEAAQHPRDAEIRKKIAGSYDELGMPAQVRFWKRAAAAVEAGQ